MTELSLRGQDWKEFSDKVLKHIEEYTVPQYGDRGSDNASKKSSQWCIDNIERYCARFGSNSRNGQEELDLFKIAHNAQIAHYKDNNSAS